MRVVFQLYDVLRFDSTVFINALIQYVIPKAKKSIIWKHGDHEHASGSTATPKAELFCSCKRRIFIGQNEDEICKS